MSDRRFDPQRLDMVAFARAGAELRGDWPLAGFGRLMQDAAAPASSAVAWSAQGRQLERAGAQAQIRLHLHAHAAVEMQCQRCLQPVDVRLEVDRELRFVADEAEAERLDADSDEDVLAIEPALDLHRLLEDELILALPLVPRHDDCTLPAGGMAAGDDAHPFAELAALRRGERR